MTDRVDSQEAEDVAFDHRPCAKALQQLVEKACQCDDVDGVHFHRSDALPILARLVREGQIRALNATRSEIGHYRRGLVRDGVSVHELMPLDEALGKLDARIAALKGEG